MLWQQLKITVAEPEAENISEWLSEQSALSVTFSDAADTPIFEPELNTTPLWNSVVVLGLFDKDRDVKAVLAQFAEQFPQLSCIYETVADQDWHKVWMDDYHPLQFGKNLWICPSWCVPPKPQAVNIKLDPGMAFGTGTHATTALCLTWLDTHPPVGKQVLDFGCGSGILGLAALKLGANFVWAVDHDSQALSATRQNMENNAISIAQCATLLPTELPIDLEAELILANILANPLLELAPQFASLHKTDGVLVLSGILSHQVSAILERYRQWYTILATHYQDDWACVVAKRL